MRLGRFSILLLLLVLAFGSLPLQAQNADELVSLDVRAGFDSFFRPSYWLPLRIEVRNDGDALRGRITVRPETTGRELETAFSTPIELPSGSEKTVFLYIQVRQATQQVLVELITDDGVRVKERLVGLSRLDTHDALHVVVSGTAANSLALQGVSATGYSARQARWEVAEVPPQYQALMAVNTFVLYDVNSEDFTVGQRAAIQQWVSMGGHLIVIGGPSWTQTANGIQDWLPLVPTSSQNVDGLGALSSYLGGSDALSGRSFVTTGTVQDDARVLVETDTGLPLLIRGKLGLGTVDYLSVDPTLEPLRSWESLQDFWITILANAEPEPGWIRGILDRDFAARSVAILPGVDLLPSVLSMMGFILAYILMIGPLNYLLLSKLNRRAWAWLTIPILIGVFTALAWTVGFNLRGSQVIVSRQFVVQSFVGQDVARQDELVALFSPRREIYSISAPPDTFLQVLPSLSGDTILQPGVRRSTVEIVEADRFSAEHVVIDGGIFANFGMMSTVPAPQVEGRLTLNYDPSSEIGRMLIRGFIRNDSDIKFEDGVIFTRNQFYRLSGDLSAGDVLDFDTSDFHLIHAEEDNLLPMSSPLETVSELELSSRSNNSAPVLQSLVLAQVALGTTPWTTAARFRDDLTYIEDDSAAMNRRRNLLYSFMRDQYAMGNVGNRAFFIGWSNETHPADIEVSNNDYRMVDTSFYMIELDVNVEQPPSAETVTISPDQFTWSVREREAGQAFGGLNDLLIINPGWAVFRFEPLDDAVLANVDYMRIVIDRSSSYGRELDFGVRNWETQAWDSPETNRIQELYEFENPSAFLGPNNMVDIRLRLDRMTTNLTASARVRGVRIVMRGNF